MKNIVTNTFYAIVGLLVVAGLYACERNTPEPGLSDFDRKEMLQNIGNNIIIPGYQHLHEQSQNLDAVARNFAATPTPANLVSLRQAFESTYLAWQRTSVFEFGPAMQVVLRSSVNTFPTQPDKISSNIASGTYDLNAASNINAKGFPALDYLLFGYGDASATLAQYTVNERAEARKAYLVAVTNDIKQRVQSTYNGWLPGQGNYIATFESSAGTDMGSSLGRLVNEFNFDYEILKNYRIAVPLGKRTLGVAMPDKVEAYYSNLSAKLAKAHLAALENLYLGRSAQEDGKGLDDYLVKLNARHGNGSLAEAIRKQFEATKLATEALPDPLAETIKNNPALVDKAYLEMQRLVVLTKADMPSAMGILITYQDNDGD